VTLDLVSDGVEVRVLRTDLDAPLARRLAELGIRDGQLLTPLHRTAGGARVVAVGDTRVALARSVLRRIEVAA
jgi:Fe2+ transport system protein FeoA